MSFVLVFPDICSDMLSKYLHIKAAVLQYESVKSIFNFRFHFTAGWSGSPLVCLLVWTGCKEEAGRNLTAATEFLKAGVELLSKCNVSRRNREKLNTER